MSTTPAAAAAVDDERPPRNATFAPRRWHERGSADHGWLKTFHTFSFASYYDPTHMQFGPLRVINEDRVAPKTGFPKHPHNNAEIFSYIISGELTHRDSMNNLEVLKRGEVQFTSAGRGIAHSEYNDHPTKEVHFLQIWYTPDARNLQPKYYTLPQCADEAKRDTLMPLIRSYRTFSDEELALTGLLPQGRAIPAHADLTTSASVLSPGSSVVHRVGSGTRLAEGAPRWVYVHLAMTNVGWRDPQEYRRQLRSKLVTPQPLDRAVENARSLLRRVYGWAPDEHFNVVGGGGAGRAAEKVDQGADDSSDDRPSVTLTFAQSLDGMIAGPGGRQLALSGRESMVMTHTLRMMHDGILVGVGTLLNDDPQLNARLLEADIPVSALPRPIVLDAHLRTPTSAKLLRNAAAGDGRAPLIVCARVGDDGGAAAERKAALESAGATVLEVDVEAADADADAAAAVSGGGGGSGGGVELPWRGVLSALRREAGVRRLMVEGGARVISSLLRAHEAAASPAPTATAAGGGRRAGLVDHVVTTVAKKRVGCEGTSFEAPPWLARTLLPGRGRRGRADGEGEGEGDAGALDLVTLSPEPMGNDVVLAWSRDAASHLASSSSSSSSSSGAARAALVRVGAPGAGTMLEEGDGVYIRGTRVGETLRFQNLGRADAEFLVFDVEPSED